MLLLTIGYFLLTLNCNIVVGKKRATCHHPQNDGVGGNVDLERYLQPLNVGRDRRYDNLENNDGIICTRDCNKYKEPRICYYKFVVEQYDAMGPACRNCSSLCQNCSRVVSDCYRQQCIQADGIERTVFSVNRMIPGTAIDVCFGDRIVVDVDNRMLSNALTIHWHGVLQQLSPWNDGVPYVTQCPIPPNQIFRYNFLAQTEGTNFYHSHLGSPQRDGVYGALIVRTTDQMEPNRQEYDYDLPSHVINVADWKHYPADVFWPGYFRNISHTVPNPDSYLINGRGSYKDSVTRTNTPHARFYVRHGYRYRFRIIADVTSNCLYQIAFQDHSLTIISLDGYAVVPVRGIRTLTMGAGQRIDVVIQTNQERKSYYIVVKGIDQCLDTTPPQTAYLIYDNSPARPTTTYNWRRIIQAPYFGDVEKGCNTNPNVLCTDALRSLKDVPRRVTGVEPDYRFFLAATGYSYTYDELFETNTYHLWHDPNGESPGPQGGPVVDGFNNYSSTYPPYTLLTQTGGSAVENETFCPERRCELDVCFCIHVLKVELNSIVELVLVDEVSFPGDTLNHPMHLHGHYFSVLKQGSAEELSRPRFWLNVTDAPNPAIRDTSAVPAYGFEVLRWVAVNPGMWLFHCHFNDHLNGGMFVIFQVGKRSEFRRPPKGFPKCNNYLPAVKYDFSEQ